jgi:hypothetical protein
MEASQPPKRSDIPAREALRKGRIVEHLLVRFGRVRGGRVGDVPKA